MKYILGNPEGVNIYQIIDIGNNEHFSKLTCSIIPTIDYWKNLNNRVLTDIAVNDYNICFEYPVKSILKAKSSYTDIMLISDNLNIAIESKWNEKIGNYCKNHKAKQKDQVQQHWIDIISKYIKKDLDLEQFQNIEYQLLHRVASACSLKKDNCIVVYQIFYDNKLSESFKKEIQKIISILDSPKIKFYVNSLKIEYKNTYINLQKEIQGTDKKERIIKIKNAIKKHFLFDFKEESIVQV